MSAFGIDGLKEELLSVRVEAFLVGRTVVTVGERRRRAGKRTVARRLALQLLYEYDLRGALDERRVRLFLKRFAPVDDVNSYARCILNGVLVHRKELDSLIGGLCRNWGYERVSPVERSVLRIAVYEMLYGVDVPTKVAINEAVELAKRFATKDAASFINGILHTLASSKGLLGQSPQQ